MSFMMLLTFPSGSTDGAVVCANVTVIRDNMVECEEEFSLLLTLETATIKSLSLGNNTTSVVLRDSDCKPRQSLLN